VGEWGREHAPSVKLEVPPYFQQDRAFVRFTDACFHSFSSEFLLGAARSNDRQARCGWGVTSARGLPLLL
jgi:hypothetical protein